MPQASTNRRHFVWVGVLVFISTIVMYLLLVAVLPLPPQASSQAIIIDRMINVHLVLISFFFALIMVFMLYAAVVFRRKEGDDSDGEHFEGNTALEIAWTGLPLVLVIVLGVYGITSFNNVVREHPDELAINAIGNNWQWTFHYGDPDNQVAELVVPVDQPIVMNLESLDVLHSFWVPAFRVKQDLVPGRVTTVRFIPVETGEYRLRCAELCGQSHYTMLAPVRVVEQSEFTAWLDENNIVLQEQADELAAAE